MRGVALHDRGYGQLDADGIGEVDPDRWTAIQEAGFTPTGDDPVVDLVVAMHVQRLVSWGRSDADQAVAARMAAELPLYQAAAGVDAASAAAEADAITNLCDMVAFDFCVEREASGSVAVAPTAGAEPVAVSYQLDGAGGIVLSPWPLGVTELSGVALGFRSDGLPPCARPGRGRVPRQAGLVTQARVRFRVSRSWCSCPRSREGGEHEVHALDQHRQRVV